VTHHDAFLQAILENHDDTPRPIDAAFHDEHGDLERAEFLRVRSLLAGLERD
jgi:uncharacterized protein (TIGR02996 family)